MWAAHPISNLAPPLVVVEGCGCAQNVEAGTQDKDDRVIPIVDGHHGKHPRKDGQDATEHRHEREYQQNHESGVDACSTTSPPPFGYTDELHDSTLPGREGEDSRSKDVRCSGRPGQ